MSSGFQDTLKGDRKILMSKGNLSHNFLYYYNYSISYFRWSIEDRLIYVADLLSRFNYFPTSDSEKLEDLLPTISSNVNNDDETSRNAVGISDFIEISCDDVFHLCLYYRNKMRKVT